MTRFPTLTKAARAYADATGETIPDGDLLDYCTRLLEKGIVTHEWSDRSQGWQATWLLDADVAGGRRRGGPWRWRRNGDTGVIHTRTLNDAKALLRREMGRKRLPKGMEWTCEG